MSNEIVLAWWSGWFARVSHTCMHSAMVQNSSFWQKSWFVSLSHQDILQADWAADFF